MGGVQHTATDAPNPQPSPQRRRGRRVVVILLRGAAWTVLALTLASGIFNALTTPPRTTPAPHGQDIHLPTGRLHYQAWGTDKPGQPIVLVHGFAEHSSAWELVAGKLSAGHPVYAIDLPGFGYSEYTGKYTLADETAALEGFIDAKKLSKPVVVGHSLGAAVVGSLALKEPTKLGGIVFADGDALPFSKGSSRSSAGNVITRLPWFTSLYRLGTRWDWAYEGIFRSACGSQCRGYSRKFVDRWMAPMRQGDAEAAMKTMARANMLALTPEQVRSITVPTAIIWGDEDERSGGSLPGLRKNLAGPPEVVIPKAGHLPMVAQPDAFADGLLRLIPQLKRSS